MPKRNRGSWKLSEPCCIGCRSDTKRRRAGSTDDERKENENKNESNTQMESQDPPVESLESDIKLTETQGGTVVNDESVATSFQKGEVSILGKKVDLQPMINKDPDENGNFRFPETSADTTLASADLNQNVKLTASQEGTVVNDESVATSSQKGEVSILGKKVDLQPMMSKVPDENGNFRFPETSADTTLASAVLNQSPCVSDEMLSWYLEEENKSASCPVTGLSEGASDMDLICSSGLLSEDLGSWMLPTAPEANTRNMELPQSIPSVSELGSTSSGNNRVVWKRRPNHFGKPLHLLLAQEPVSPSQKPKRKRLKVNEIPCGNCKSSSEDVSMRSEFKRRLCADCYNNLRTLLPRKLPLTRPLSTGPNFQSGQIIWGRQTKHEKIWFPAVVVDVSQVKDIVFFRKSVLKRYAKDLKKQRTVFWIHERYLLNWSELSSGCMADFLGHFVECYNEALVSPEIKKPANAYDFVTSVKYTVKLLVDEFPECLSNKHKKAVVSYEMETPELVQKTLARELWKDESPKVLSVPVLRELIDFWYECVDGPRPQEPPKKRRKSFLAKGLKVCVPDPNKHQANLAPVKPGAMSTFL